MAQAAARLPQPSFAPESANDNRPTRDGDRWRDLIDRLKRANLPSVAILAIRFRLRGWGIDEFCDELIARWETDQRIEAAR